MPTVHLKYKINNAQLGAENGSFIAKWIALTRY